ncbi:MAG TPA: serine/threonine-protein kinase, partial [Planctomycetaceae bacterium]|nr:serine/threonine-protein kinase [Planctomycetaceae bacterium]
MMTNKEFGRYRISRLLGAGAMGSVLLAHDTILEREVALKIPVLKEKDQQKSEQRFFREARAAAAIRHPNICPIYDVGIIDETFYISMGYIEGKTLAHLMDEAGSFPQDEAADLVRRIALALYEAHQKGVVHRDLKPNNIMIDRRGEPIVTDFGLAYSYESEDEERLTRDGMTVGTPGYMSPEQVCGSREIQPASDIFSLGILLYELVCGKRPFAGKSMILMGHIAHGEPIDPKEFREDIDPGLEAIIRHALEKKPKDRFASMQEFAETLEDFVHNRPCKLRQNSSTTNPELLATSNVSDTVREQPSLEFEALSGIQRRWPGRNVGLIVAACLVGVLIGGLVFGFLTDEPVPPAKPNVEPGGDRNTMERPQNRSNRNVLFDASSIPVRGFDPAELFEEYDQDRNGYLHPREFPKHVIERADSDFDGEASKDEFLAAHERLGDDLMLPGSRRGPGGPRGDRPPPRPPDDGRRFERPPPRGDFPPPQREND